MLTQTHLQVDGNKVIDRATRAAYQPAQIALPGNQILLQSDSSTTFMNRTEYMLVTFTDDTKSTVEQVENFALSDTLLPASQDWTLNVATVFTLFAFELLSSVLSTFGFAGVWFRSNQRSKMSKVGHVAVATGSNFVAALVTSFSLLSIIFYINLLTTPPKIIGVQFAFIALQVLAVLRCMVIFSLVFLVIQHWKERHAVFVIWCCLILFQAIGTVALYALNLITFTVW
jgi:hypothetical protein